MRVKDLDSHAVKALLASRALLVKIKRDLENQIRGLLKNFGLVIGRGKFKVFAVRAAELIENRPELIAAVRPLLEARKAIEQQVDDFDRKVHKLARHDVQVRRFMTVPGVGPITALCFKATIDDPTRFKRSRSVGAYIGLTTRRHASGEIDWSGRISKCGDAMLRMYFFEAAGVLLTRVPKWSGLKAWGAKLTKRNGLRKAKVAVARKLAVILHRMWIDGTEFNWSGCRGARMRSQGSRDTAGKVVPAGTVAVVRSSDFLRASKRTTALATLVRQRRLTPSCGGHAPSQAGGQILGWCTRRLRAAIRPKIVERMPKMPCLPSPSQRKSDDRSTNTLQPLSKRARKRDNIQRSFAGDYLRP